MESIHPENIGEAFSFGQIVRQKEGREKGGKICLHPDRKAHDGGILPDLYGGSLVGRSGTSAIGRWGTLRVLPEPSGNDMGQHFEGKKEKVRPALYIQ